MNRCCVKWSTRRENPRCLCPDPSQEARWLMDAVALWSGVPTRAVIAVDERYAIYARGFWAAVAVDHEGSRYGLEALLDETWRERADARLSLGGMISGDGQ